MIPTYLLFDYFVLFYLSKIQLVHKTMKYIPHNQMIYETDFDDQVLSIEWKESELENDDLKNYKAKAEFYVRQHQDNAVIVKLKSNIPLTESDILDLERIARCARGFRKDRKLGF